MTDNTSLTFKRIRPKHDIDNALKRKIEKTPIIESEAQYSQESGRQSNTSKTKDAVTETCIKTDNVHITADIYSVTDLPSSFQTNEESPRPGTVVPEYYDDKCVILRASRSKSVNTDGEFSSAEPCLLLKCIFPCIETKEKPRPRKIEWLDDNARMSPEAERIQVSRELSVFRCRPNRAVEVKGSLLKCKESCPNLVINRTSQTNGRATERAEEPEEQCDNRHVAVSVMTLVTLGETDGERTCVKSTKTPIINLKSCTQMNLAAIQELEEGDAQFEEPSPKNHQETETEASEHAISDIQSDADEASLSMKEQQEVETVASTSVLDSEDEELESLTVSEAEWGNEERLTEDETVEPIDKTQDVAIDAADLKGIMIAPLGQKKESSKSSRRPSTCIFETGTIISSQSISWMDTPRKRRGREEICARTSESVCRCSGTNDRFPGWPKIVQPSRSNCMVQCEMVKNVASHSTSNQTFCSEPMERYSRCYNCATRSCNEEPARWRNSNEFWPMDYSTSKSNPCPGSFQGEFMRHQLCRINNTQRGCSIPGGPLENCARNRSIRNNACNQYYLNFNKADNTVGRYCWCNGGYNLRNPNMLYSAARSQMVYHTPHGYYCSFRTWY